MKKFVRSRGFTLLEILLVIAIIAILAAIVIIAINPGRQLAQSRNAQRWTNVNTILNAVYQYNIDNGILPDTITETQTEICTSEVGDACVGLINLSVVITDEIYLVAIPSDPTGASGEGVGYEILKTTTNRVTVAAPDAELGETIQVTR